MTAEAQSPVPRFSLGAIILGAGQSSRMGRPKMLLPWGRTSVLGHLIQTWEECGEQVAVVCALGDSAIEAELDRLKFSGENRIYNPEPARGMFSSVQCAACWEGWQPSLTHWAVVLGDQPHLQPATLTALIDFARGHADRICQPSYGGHARHPIIFPATAFKRLASSDTETLQKFLQSFSGESTSIELPDPGLDLDIDVPADYEKALKLFASS